MIEFLDSLLTQENIVWLLRVVGDAIYKEWFRLLASLVLFCIIWGLGRIFFKPSILLGIVASSIAMVTHYLVLLLAKVWYCPLACPLQVSASPYYVIGGLQDGYVALWGLAILAGGVASALVILILHRMERKM